MNEGEFKKRMRKIEEKEKEDAAYYGEYLDHYVVSQWLDEARKEFPLVQKPTKVRGYGDPILSEHERFVLALKTLLECDKWFLKWFGSRSAEK